MFTSWIIFQQHTGLKSSCHLFGLKYESVMRCIVSQNCSLITWTDFVESTIWFNSITRHEKQTTYQITNLCAIIPSYLRFFYIFISAYLFPTLLFASFYVHVWNKFGESFHLFLVCLNCRLSRFVCFYFIIFIFFAFGEHFCEFIFRFPFLNCTFYLFFLCRHFAKRYDTFHMQLPNTCDLCAKDGSSGYEKRAKQNKKEKSVNHFA